jgi:glyoxylase-like metal-dependent hydrolase (beta-lactamase superfamily II)/rhodanese-related sulfurtransferase
MRNEYNNLVYPSHYKYKVILHIHEQLMSLEIKPDELKKKIDGKDNVFLLDVRTPQEYETWKLSYEGHEGPKLIPVDQLFSHLSEVLGEIPKDKEIITICSHGNRSMMAANMLNRLGYNVKSLHGGMSGWNSVYDVAEIPVADQEQFRIWQVRRVSKGCMGYVVASLADKTAVVIDPCRENYEVFIKVAEEIGNQITKVIDTHQHADHVSGVAKLVKALSSNGNNKVTALYSSEEDYEVGSGESNEVKFVKGGDEIEVGSEVKLKAIHTPGHTNGSMSFLLSPMCGNTSQDNTSSESIGPAYLFTGDTLFVDSIGRPDLRDKSSEFASQMYETYHQKIASLPDSTIILPAHFNTTSCSLKHEIPVLVTFSSLRKKLNGIAIRKEDFVDFVSRSIPPRPMNYKTIISLNKKMLSYDEMLPPYLEAGPNSCAIQSPQTK